MMPLVVDERTSLLRRKRWGGRRSVMDSEVNGAWRCENGLFGDRGDRAGLERSRGGRKIPKKGRKLTGGPILKGREDLQGKGGGRGGGGGGKGSRKKRLGSKSRVEK